MILLDVDGTIVESGKSLSKEMTSLLKQLCKKHQVYIVAGAGKKKVEKQLKAILPLLAGYFTSSGAEYTSSRGYSKLPHPRPIQLVRGLINYSLMVYSPNPNGPMLETRPSMYNFCPVGKKATDRERQHFIEWDTKTQFRKKLLTYINKLNISGVKAVLGGQCSIDIYCDGFLGKIEVMNQFSDPKDIVFIGDRIMSDGNDYDLARYITKNKLGKVFKVKSPNDTTRILKKML